MNRKPVSNGATHQPEITLYIYASSPFAAKTYFYLIYKRLKFKVVYVHPLKRTEIAFTNQAIIPVLKIGEEWRLESSDHGQWLEERFPEYTILGETEQERKSLIALEAEISGILMPAAFRSMAQPRTFMEQMREGWNLGRIMHQTSKTPLALVPIWPLLIRRAPFLKHAAFMFAPDLTGEAFQEKVLNEMERLIGEGPFFGGHDRISQADLTAYSAVYISNQIPLTGAPRFFERSIIQRWVKAVETQLPETFHTRLFPHAGFRLNR